MTSASFLKSKAFKEREENAREKVRQTSKQDLLADLSRLYGDTTFSDVSFAVCNSEFQAHTVVLRARAPNFCWNFLPRHSSPVSVQTCIQINGLEATEFETFLRSAYTEDDFKDYNESSYPWRSQKTSCLADEINHVVCETELKPDNSSFQNDVDGSHGIIQPCCAIDGCWTTTTTANAVESCRDDVKYTQSQCGDMQSNNSKIAVRDTTDVLENSERAEHQQSNDEDFQTHSVSPCLCGDVVNNTELAGQESSRSHVVTASNTTQENDTLNEADQPQDQADQKNIDFVVNGLHTGVLEKGNGSVCPQRGCDSCIPISRCLFNGQAEGIEEDITCKLTSTDAKIVENSFRPKQDLNLTVDHRAPDKPSESELESCCSKLGQDLLQLFTSGVGYDVIFLVNGGKVKAHKAILCARSNYFSAMLYGDWIEGKTNEIPLVGVSYNGFMTILKYLYGGITQVKSDSSLICDTLPLVDMYGLEGLREIIICTLKIDKCHMFHKPCAECLAGVPECLEVSELFSLADLRKSCIKWMAKHFDRVLASKGFATLPKKLQEEILAEIGRSFVISSAVEVLNHCDKLSSCTPLVKWTEPVHVAVSTVQESCLLFISNNFVSMIDERSFHEILKGVGWSVPVLEKILAAVKKHLTIENCCDQLRAILMLKRIIKLKTQEEGEECYPEEVVDLVVHLHNDCVKFARSNLFKVTRSDGWKRLKYATQREIKEGAVFSGFGDSGDRSNTKQRSAPPSAQASSRPPTRNTSQRAGTEPRSRGFGRGNATVDGQLYRRSQNQRPSSTRSLQGRTALAPSNKRPSSALPSSTQGSLMLGRGKMSSASKGAAEKRPLTTWGAGTSGSSRLSAQTSSTSGRGKVLPSKSNEPSTRSSCQPAGKFQPASSNKKNRSVLTQENSTRQPSSAPSSYGVTKKAPAKSRPALVSGNDKRFTREKPLGVEGSRVRTKNIPTGPKDACVSGASQSRPKQSKAPIASCNPNKASASTDCKEDTSRKNRIEVLEASTEKSSLEEKSQAIETDSSRTSEQVETLDSENECSSQGGAQANSPGTVNTQDTSKLFNEAEGEGCLQSPCHDSPDGSNINDSLELD